MAVHCVTTQPHDAKCSQKSQVMLLIRTLLRTHCSSPGLCPSRDIFTVFDPMDICLCSLFLLCGMFQDSFWEAEFVLILGNTVYILYTKSVSRAWRPKSAVVDTWMVSAPFSSCCVCVNPWNFSFQKSLM